MAGPSCRISCILTYFAGFPAFCGFPPPAAPPGPYDTIYSVLHLYHTTTYSSYTTYSGHMIYSTTIYSIIYILLCGPRRPVIALHSISFWGPEYLLAYSISRFIPGAAGGSPAGVRFNPSVNVYIWPLWVTHIIPFGRVETGIVGEIRFFVYGTYTVFVWVTHSWEYVRYTLTPCYNAHLCNFHFFLAMGNPRSYSIIVDGKPIDGPPPRAWVRPQTIQPSPGIPGPR
jgi:hypothetical protein